MRSPPLIALPEIPAGMTVAEFFAWNPSTPLPWQLIDGEPQTMARGSRTHGAIQSQVAHLIAGYLEARGGPCTILTTPNVIPRIQSKTNVRIPDLAVICSAYEFEESALEDPVLLIEIHSPNNRAEIWANVWAYATLPSVQEILVFSTASIGAELLRRNPDGSWPSEPLMIETGDVTLESIGFSFPLVAAYRTTYLAARN
ncbi:Uma2 family endonuclease [Methylocapsa acidiphila]|uniref:Uma2 family endonuclease n=1 Tax=Methylocapsa acidiphila TaxID=133552 RepID=UPI0031586DE6